MSKFKKIFLMVGIVAVLMVMSVVSVSAMAPSLDVPSVMMSTPNVYCFQYNAEVQDLNEIEFSPQIIVVEFVDSNGHSYYSAILLKSFYEDFDINSNMSADDVWNKIISMPNGFQSGYEWYLGYLNDGYYFNSGISYLTYYEESIKKAYSEQYLYWIDYSEEYANEQKEPLETQIGELNTTITEKDAVITEKDTTISTLEGENAELESDVSGLNTQVADLVQDKAELNATIKSLEKQLQIKVDKAYAEGLTDADNKNTPVPIIIGILTLLDIVAIVVFIVSKVKKSKKIKKGGH